jgi:uncharacterized membrane protein (UPF0127 family)
LPGRNLVLGSCGRYRRNCSFQKEVMIDSQHLGLAEAAGLSRAFNLTRGQMIAHQVKTAVTMLDRRTGLLNRETFEPGEGLHIVPCDSIHTMGMRFPIDVLFLDGNGAVLVAWRNIPPGRSSMTCVGASSALELPAGMIDATGTKARDTIQLEGAC